MTKHPKEVMGFDGSIDDLAGAVGNMSYDSLSVFIEKLADDLTRQADADKANGKVQLAEELYATADKLYDAKEKMDAAWKICEPYMK